MPFRTDFRQHVSTEESPTHSKPRNPGTPKPGVRISIKIPRTPNERRSELIRGFVIKKTILSASVASTSVTRAPANVFRRLISEVPNSCCRVPMPSSVRGSLVPSTSTFSYCANSSVRFSACASANPYSNACWVDNVSNFPEHREFPYLRLLLHAKRILRVGVDNLTSVSFTRTSSLSTIASAISGFRFSRSAVARIVP